MVWLQFEPNLVGRSLKRYFLPPIPMRYASRGLSLSVVLLFSVSILSVFVAAQDDQNNHPTEEQPYMYFWGEEDLFECWNNFDSNASAGSSTGYGEIDFPEGQDVSVDFSCNMQMGFLMIFF